MRAMAAALSLALVLALSGLISASAQTWNEVRPEGGKYRILMPGTPKTSTHPVTLPGGRTVQMLEVLLDLQSTSYFSSHVDYPPGVLAPDPEVTLRNVRDGSTKGHTLRTDRRLTIGGYPAREYVYQQADGIILVTRSIMVGDRLSIRSPSRAIPASNTGRKPSGFSIRLP